MYTLVGPTTVLKTLATLATPYTEGPIKRIPQLKSAFGQFLQTTQSHFPPSALNGEVFSSWQQAPLFAELFRADGAVLDGGQHNLIDKPLTQTLYHERREKAQQSLIALQENAPIWADIFHVVARKIFFYDSARAESGSSFNAIGIIWLTGNRAKTRKDYQELLIHELTHQLVAIDNLRYGHIKTSKHQQEEFYSQSAILKIQRPIHKVIHSIIVGVELIYARHRGLVSFRSNRIHGSTAHLIMTTLQAVKNLLSHPKRDEFLSSRSIPLLEGCLRLLLQAQYHQQKKHIPLPSKKCLAYGKQW